MKSNHKKRIKTSPEVRRRQILDAARLVLADEDYRDIRLDDVALKAGIAKGTLYLHFKDKNQIMVAVYEDLMDQLENRLFELKKFRGLSLLKKAAEVKLDFFRENHDFFSQFMRFKGDLVKTNKDVMQKRFQRHLRVMQQLIHDAVLRKEIPEHDPFMGSFYFVNLIRMFWVMDKFFQKKSKNSKNAERLMQFFLHGIHGVKKTRALHR